MPDGMAENGKPWLDGSTLGKNHPRESTVLMNSQRALVCPVLAHFVFVQFLLLNHYNFFAELD
jgi:hypothetical protein